MSRFLSMMLAVVGICCFCSSDFGPYGNAKAATPAEKDQQTRSTRIALVDMTAVFMRSSLFKERREALKVKITETEASAREMVKEIQETTRYLETRDKQLDEYQTVEGQLKRQQTEFEEFRKTRQAEFLKQEMEINREVYTAIAKSVAEYAKEHEIDLVMPINPENILAEQDPKKFMQSMTKQIVYGKNLDITESVIDAMNGQ